MIESCVNKSIMELSEGDLMDSAEFFCIYVLYSADMQLVIFIP